MGSTAAGKTDWAVKWAKQSQIHSPSKKTGILNADSIQVYKDLNKGSAKPDFSKYPDIEFYLFDILKAPEVCTAGLFRTKALNILKEKLPEEKIFVVGGSGFYLQALEKGMYPIKKSNLVKKSEPLKRNLIEKKGVLKNQISQDSGKTQFSKGKFTACEFKNQISQNAGKTQSLNQLYQELKIKDPETAEKISSNDRYRILRALELIDTEKTTLSQIKKEFREQKLPWGFLKIGLSLSKEELFKKVTQRTEAMLRQGLIEEVEGLLARDLKAWRALNSIGYKEVQLYLEGHLKKEDLTSAIISATMRLAKKQKTWFKKDKSIKWFDGNLDPVKIYKQLFQ